MKFREIFNILVFVIIIITLLVLTTYIAIKIQQELELKKPLKLVTDIGLGFIVYIISAMFGKILKI